MLEFVLWLAFWYHRVRLRALSRVITVGTRFWCCVTSSPVENFVKQFFSRLCLLVYCSAFMSYSDPSPDGLGWVTSYSEPWLWGWSFVFQPDSVDYLPSISSTFFLRFIQKCLNSSWLSLSSIKIHIGWAVADSDIFSLCLLQQMPTSGNTLLSVWLRNVSGVCLQVVPPFLYCSCWKIILLSSRQNCNFKSVI